MDMKKSVLTVIIAAILFASFGLFTGAKENADNAAPPYGGRIIIGVDGDVDTFNPLFNESSLSQQMTHLLLLGLADLDENSQFSPELATSWQSSPDHLKLTYYLREDAYWSDGTPITASDVTFTYDLLMNPEVPSPRQETTEYIKSVVADDPHTVTFTFTKAYPDQIFDTAGEILPRHILAGTAPSELSSHPFGHNPVSSGPFVLKKWVDQQYIEIIPNERYFGGRPYLEKVIFKVVPDQSNRLLQMQTGEIDMMMDVPPEEVAYLRQANPNVNIYPVSGRVYHYMGYNHSNPLFADKKVRQALTMSIDRAGIINTFLYGFGTPCLGPIPPMIKTVKADNITAFPFNPEKSKEMLAEMGWQDSNHDGWLDKNGETFNFTLKINAGNQLRSDIAVIIQEQLRRIGVKVDVQTVEWSTLIDELQSGDFDASLGAWSTSFNVDLTPIFHSSSTDLFNFVGYRNDEVDALITSAREEMDSDIAASTWAKTQRMIYDDQPYTFLFWLDKIVAVNNKFGNVTPLPLSAFYNLEKWYRVGTN